MLIIIIIIIILLDILDFVTNIVLCNHAVNNNLSSFSLCNVINIHIFGPDYAVWLLQPFQVLATVVQTLDSAIHRINNYPADKYYRNRLCYPLDRDLSGG